MVRRGHNEPPASASLGRVLIIVGSSSASRRNTPHPAGRSSPTKTPGARGITAASDARRRRRRPAERGTLRGRGPFVCRRFGAPRHGPFGLPDRRPGSAVQSRLPQIHHGSRHPSPGNFRNGRSSRSRFGRRRVRITAGRSIAGGFSRTLRVHCGRAGERVRGTSKGANNRPATVPPSSGAALTLATPMPAAFDFRTPSFSTPARPSFAPLAPGRLEADNCLKVGGALFDLREWPTVRDVVISARHLTLRRAEALCWARIPKTAGRKAQLRAALDECVFDLAGPQAGLLRLTSEGTPSGHDPRFVVTGDGSVIRPDVPIVAWTTPAAPGRTPAEPSNAVVEGLAVGEFQFVGQAGSTAAGLTARFGR